MFDAHVNTAVAATQDYMKSIGKDYSFEQSAGLFRDAAFAWCDNTLWEGYEEWVDRQALSDWFDEQADRAAYERMVEM